MSLYERSCYTLASIILIVLTLVLSCTYAFAHEHGRTDANWEKMSDEEKAWLMTLKQPDSPTTSCCGVADQYWCDRVYVREGKGYCQITDDRDDNDFISVMGTPRPHVPIGTEIEIPPEKMKFGPKDLSKQQASNPSGHTIVFMSKALFVYCFVMATGG